MLNRINNQFIKSNVFIFHGTAGYPEENWFPWTKEKLQEKGCEVTVPQFPTPEGQSLQAWLDVFEPYSNTVDENTIIIGHSLGGVFLLKLLERFQKPIKLAILVATPIGIKPISVYNDIVDFAGFEFDWDKIKTNAKDFIVYQSDNDPYVSLGNGEKLAKHLGVDLTFIPNVGHFNAKAGYLQFEDLFKKLEKYL